MLGGLFPAPAYYTGGHGHMPGISDAFGEIMASKGRRNDPEQDNRQRLLDELESLRARVLETEGLPDLASAALRKARARAEEYRVAYGVATDELARARAQLTGAWRVLKSVEFAAPAYSLARDRPEAGSRRRGACPACGGLESHSPACELARTLDLVRDPRPRRRELEEAVDRQWLARTGEKEGVRARLEFLDLLFGELEKWGVVRED